MKIAEKDLMNSAHLGVRISFLIEILVVSSSGQFISTAMFFSVAEAQVTYSCLYAGWPSTTIGNVKDAPCFEPNEARCDGQPFLAMCNSILYGGSCVPRTAQMMTDCDRYGESTKTIAKKTKADPEFGKKWIGLAKKNRIYL